MEGDRRTRSRAKRPPADVATIAAGLPIAYCERWNSVLEMPFNPMGEGEARSRHEKGELYTALLGDPAAPEAMVEVRLETGYVATHFFDDCLGNVFSYIYDERDGRLFFDSYSERQWDKKGSLRAAEAYDFEPDGHVYVSKLDAVTNMEETYEQWATVADNWEDIPAFVDYSGVLRVEREINPLDSPPGSRSV